MSERRRMAKTDAQARDLEERERRLAEREAQIDEAFKKLGIERPEATKTAATKTAAAKTVRRRARTAVKEPEGDATRETPAAAAAAETREAPAAAPKRAARDSGVVLEVEHLNVHYGNIQALRGINLTIRRGEVVALLGANGAGKSSTLRAISGMVAPSGGDIRLMGAPIGGLKAHQVVKHGIAHVPEGRELFPTLTVEENLRLGYWPQRKEAGRLKDAYERVYTMFPRMGERRNQAAGTMSGGEQQMLVFARALMSSPELLLVDEMSLGLAPMIVRTLFEAVDQIHREGKSVIIVEQFVHQALRHAQRAYVLGKGEVVLEAAADKLRNDPKLLAAYLGGAEGNVEEAAKSKAKPRATRKANGKGPTRPAPAGAKKESKPRSKA